MSDIVERLKKHRCWMRHEGMAVVADDAPFEAADEIERLRDRLEMRHAYKVGDGDKLERIEVELGSIPDGIDARDATIELQDKRIAQLEARLAEAVESLRAINRRASPDPARTFDDSIRDLEHVTALARAFMEKKP